MSKIRVLLTALIAASLVACASVPYAQRQQQRQQAYNASAGAPVQSFRLILSGFYSWEPLSDTQLVIYTQPTRAYLLDVWPCTNLTFASGIGLTSFANQVQVGFDQIFTGRGYVPCRIKQIRPVDLAQLKVEKEAQRHVDSLPRDSSQPASASSSAGATETH
ncbi:DUF6491 family protein [Dyella mobilis]|uniref:Lipoprotein n=1 Tax=Dyella mobilis TaxID=1849582 RepID=A0ABS2KBK5_9GAMM|nr:DUF6491 family protein [Dyella mobilis]MBM7128474.1 hypothetical protein [Dyella mobilis]GLQ99625.1 hypothetical protein GCM10007863_40450 [Dyella mobilis]